MTKATRPSKSKKPAEGEQDFRYMRVGYIPGDTFSHKAAQITYSRLNAQVELPRYWKWRDAEYFTKKYPGVLAWSRTSSYHMLLVSGSHTARLWTDGRHIATIDILPGLAAMLAQNGLTPYKIPEESLTKCFPMEDRVSFGTFQELDIFFNCLVSTHGLQAWVKETV